MSQPDKCNCQKLVIALLDRADALHREEIEFLQLGHADAYSKLHDLQAENERLRKAAEQVELAWSQYENGLIETPEWVKRGQVRDAVSDLRVAAKGVHS